MVVKSSEMEYLEDKRAMLKVKHERTADCVVGGFRWHKSGRPLVGSLLLGLYDSSGRLHHVGVTSSFTDATRLALAGQLEAYRTTSFEGHPWAATGQGDGPRRPGAQSRWNAGSDLSFEPLRPELVCGVAYDHLQKEGLPARMWVIAPI